MLTFLCTTEQGTIFLESEIDVDEVCASEELHNHARSHNRTDAEFHERPSVRGQDDTHPVERVRGIGRHNSIEGHLGANQEDNERDRSP